MKLITRRPRQTLALRQDLADRVHITAALIAHNPNYFVNKCIEGCLDAMESDEIAVDIPIIVLVRKICGRPVLAVKWIPAICALFVPHGMSLTPHHYRRFAVLINSHEGSLTKEAVRLYWRLADTHTKQQIAFEEQIRTLKEPLTEATEYQESKPE